MKNQILLSILFLLSFGLSVQGQTRAKTDAQGNYTAIAKTAKGTGTAATATGKFFVDAKGNKYPVMKSKNGKYFYTKVSAKTQTPYNVYLSIQ